ncbi:uncharacterized protein LOC126826952 [Patella vulgata]|uniref:uncharacterized protein LOC126826952 n=1 Tax=Patella vulgata TaxID=6465 RepID=UPI00218035FB|nr:uncharacterized protein LOC126826952 [Patella vulgata]
MKIKRCVMFAVSVCLCVLLISFNILPNVRNTEDNTSNDKQVKRNQNWDIYVRENPPDKHTVETNSTSRYLIYHCGGSGICGGWTDRLKGIVTGYILSTLTNRKFGIRITDIPCNLSSIIQPNIINWDFNPVLKKSSISNHFYVGSTQFYSNIKEMDFNVEFKKPIVYFRANLDYVDGLKQNKLYNTQLSWMKHLSRDQVYAKIIKELFTLAPDSQKLIDTFMKIALPSEKHKLVCAHVRRGRNPTIPNDSQVRVSDEDVLHVWKFLLHYNNPNIYRIFFTSDSESDVTRARNLFPDQMVDNKGQIIHFERASGQRDCEGFRKVVVDQQILMKCDVLMISFSGFSRMAAYVRGKDDDTFCLLRNHTGIIPCRPSTMKELYHVTG